MRHETPTDPAPDAPGGGREGWSRPVSAGVVSALVGFTSAFVVVLAGLTSVGADPDQASSGLLAVSVTMGLSCIVLAWSTRMPITAAWSTPGAALLATTGAVDGGWPAAVGAFLVTGALVVLTGLVPQLGALIARIPASVAQAMLAGVLLQLCLGPVTGLAANPAGVVPVVVVWLLALRLAPRWAAPLAFVTAAVVIGVHVVTSGVAVDAAALVPRVELTAPTLTPGAVVGVALPLWLVTMASQNVPGVAVMKGLGYEVPWRRSMLVTGTATVVGAPAGGHAVNLAAISAALAAGPEAGADRARRWVASVTAGVVLVVLGVASAAFGTLVALAPAGVVPAVAGLALLGTLAASLRAALAAPAEQLPAVVVFATAASGVAVAGVSAAFWALLAGLVVRAVLGVRRPRGGDVPDPVDDRPARHAGPQPAEGAVAARVHGGRDA
ncbi:benzoate/H(+) symporter BenE family transporter [Cellulomonas sp. JZ18]|uniref:benzoate/H(+) symporter BenE family transporter n=1 Tax=Cellulomonas sp. JZ18 TaxID=2654191 RepID=UPI0012D452DD|nr:benzoate/H(+) symporter BenE family transporter [Cellulomonas sp. JZ18]QGQ20527.1 benzoate/H(+) symporter BenE family transporter [Cellulomonas sp. JZ18]